MPGYRTHVGGGVLAYIAGLLVVCSYFVFKPTLFKALEWFICSILGSLFPDVDTKSKGQILFYRVTALLLLFLLWKQQIATFIWVALFAMVPVLANHRGLFHKVWFVILIPVGSALLLAKWYPTHQKALLFDAAFFSIGALSHILFDSAQTGFKRFRF